MRAPSMAGPRHVPEDAQRCTYSAGRGWRCTSLRAPGQSMCRRHHLLVSAGLANQKMNKKNEKTTSNHTAPAPPAPASPKLVRGRVVALGEVWALPHDSDRLPRAYARIERIHPTVSMVEVAPLEFDPSSPEEIRWAEARLPVSCGTFRAASHLSVLKPISSLSHLALNQVDGRVYKIFPKKNEVWAVYRDCDGSRASPLYKLVEVVSGFTEEDGVTVAGLTGGSDGLFRRQLCEGYQLVRTLSERELPLFSHRVPAFKLAGEGWGGARGVLWRIGRV